MPNQIEIKLEKSSAKGKRAVYTLMDFRYNSNGDNSRVSKKNAEFLINKTNPIFQENYGGLEFVLWKIELEKYKEWVKN